MPDSPLRFAVIMDIAFSAFQEEPRIGINRYLKESGIEAVYFGAGSLNSGSPDEMSRAAFLDMITPEEFDGIIVVSSSLLNQGGAAYLREKLGKINLPVVSIGPSICGEDSLLFDNKSSMRLIMRHLIDGHGYRNFAYVSGPRSSIEAKIRLEVYRSALDEAGISRDNNHEFEGNFLPPSGYEAVKVFLDERKLKPQVIVCANDFMALGVWNAIKDRGLNVPYDIAVTGYDDSQLAHALSHQFTTVCQPFSRLGYLAAERLHTIVNGAQPAPLENLPTELRVRSSCGCVEFDRRRSSTESAPGLTLFEEIKKEIIEYIEQTHPDKDARGIYKTWSDTVHKTIGENRPVYELEEMLRDAQRTLSAPGSEKSENPLLVTLYSLLLEECGQMVFVEYWHDNIYSMNLRILVDRLQGVLTKDLSLTAHPDLLHEIACHCGARSFQLFRFRDIHDISGGAGTIYAEGSSSLKETAAPGSWFPPRGSGSLVANMISDGADIFGYMLLDAMIPVASTFDYLRIRFSGISKDLLAISNIRRLNKDLIHEIAEREDAERRLKEALVLVEQLSVEDELTHLRNRRGFFALAEQQVKYLRRQNCSFFLLYADLDGLKTINDRYGHQEGDIAIRSAAEVLRLALRDSDIVGRMGGDEFTALINKAEPPNYEVIRERITDLCHIKNEQLGKPWTLSFSLGHFHSSEECTLELDEMLDLADDDLYREKKRKKGLSFNTNKSLDGQS